MTTFAIFSATTAHIVSLATTITDTDLANLLSTVASQN